MRSFQRYNPTTGMADFWAYFRRPQRYRWPIVAISTIPIIVTLAWANSEAVLVPPERPKVMYISTLEPGRTDEEILASNLANQAKQDALRAEREAIEARKRELYRSLGAASGMDVEAMEREAAAERARAAAAEEARRAKILAERVQPGAADAAAPADPE
ncbi:MAG: hypothetical protein ACO25F_11370 [Erythrobacter sp.]